MNNWLVRELEIETAKCPADMKFKHLGVVGLRQRSGSSCTEKLSVAHTLSWLMVVTSKGKWLQRTAREVGNILTISGEKC